LCFTPQEYQQLVSVTISATKPILSANIVTEKQTIMSTQAAMERTVKFVTDAKGKPIEVILPYRLYQELMQLKLSQEIFEQPETLWLGMKASIPAMRHNGGGAIVNISSVAGIIGSGMAAAYHGTKGAVRLLTKTAAIEYAKEGIRINSVHPGGVDTVMLDVLNPEGKQGAIQAHPLGRLATPLDIAYGVLYLASDEASFVTGAELVIDGGYTAQ
jgi:NAD(P)-dependent dehydrogenase (short-subunit alcohol dehydrogenase family)